MNWSKVFYVPQAKWKFGERTAIGQLEGWRSRAVCPVFRLSPPGDYDPEINATVTPEIYLKTFGTQLSDVRGRLPVILDGSPIEALKNEETGKLFFADLLERSRLAGANPIPLVRPNSSPDYLDVVSSFVRHSSSQAICLRIELGDLEFISDRAELRAHCERLGVDSSNCVLLVDAGPLLVKDEEGFTAIIAGQINRLVREGDWCRLVWSAGSFPEKDFLKAGESGAFERNEWKLFRTMFEAREQFETLPVFSDYLLEYPKSRPIRGVSPTAKILYSTENKYFIFKGRSVRKDDKYRNIFGVAKRVVESGVYKGSKFSAADARLEELSKGRGKTGHAGTWRWIASSHHIELVTGQLDSLLDLGLDEEKIVVEPDQLRLV